MTDAASPVPCRVKICGITSVEDALMCVEAGADALGLNFIASSKRLISLPLARSIASAVGHRALVVGVVADMDTESLLRLRDGVPLGCLQVHGHEAPSDLLPLLPHAYKGVRIAGPEDVDRARLYPGDFLLVDTYSPSALGGTGTTFDWNLVVGLAREKKLTLAGGLTPANVAQAVSLVKPYAVDVASGVERAHGRPGQKDEVKVRAFVENARPGQT